MTNKRSSDTRDTRIPTLSFGTSLALRAVLGLLVGTGIGCSAADTTPPPGSGGTHGSGGSSASGGSSGTGGSTSTGGAQGTGGKTSTGGAPGTGGAASGGTTGTGGMTGTGGSATGGSGGGAPGGGGRGAGGRGTGGSTPGTGGTSGGGGSTATGTVSPSAGCGKSGKPANGKVTVANENITDFPASYDGTKPVPLLIALHACGNPNTQWEGLTKGTAFETDYVRMFPNTTNSGQCWDAGSYAANVARIEKYFDDILANNCVDTNHVYAIGHSSGAQMLVNILSHKTDTDHLKIRAVSPVAADPYNVAEPMPVLYIDGKMDNQRSADSAKNAVAKFRTSNMCKDTSTTYSAIPGCKSSEGGVQVDPGCIIYDGCSVPTIWCSHNDPSYSGTEHGVPCFALKAMTDFFTMER